MEKPFTFQMDTRSLPKASNRVSYLYIEHAKVHVDEYQIFVQCEDGTYVIPIMQILCFMFGPGVSVTQEAIKAICASGSIVVWGGIHGQAFYAFSQSEGRSSKNMLRQIQYLTDEEKHMQVVRRMYRFRYQGLSAEQATLQQLRGMEGKRMTMAYRRLAKKYHISWKNRRYDAGHFDNSDIINQTLSTANHMLYSLCTAIELSLGYSPALGFIHTGHMASFSFDIGDLYKERYVMPLCFHCASKYKDQSPNMIRSLLRTIFVKEKLVRKITEDIAKLFETTVEEQADKVFDPQLWNGGLSVIEGGINYGKEG